MFFVLIRGDIHASSEESKNKLKYILIEIALPAVFGIPSEHILPNLGIELIKLGSVFILVSAFFITYALLKHDL